MALIIRCFQILSLHNEMVSGVTEDLNPDFKKTICLKNIWMLHWLLQKVNLYKSKFKASYTLCDNSPNSTASCQLLESRHYYDKKWTTAGYQNESVRKTCKTLREKCPYSEFFWSVFSRIWENTDQKNKRETLNKSGEFGR